MDIYFRILNGNYGIVQIENINSILPFINDCEFITLSKTHEEISVVCETKYLSGYQETSLCWRGVYIDMKLDFSLVGIISQISELLAKNNIGLYTISTYNTDYFFIKEQQFEKTVDLLKSQKNYFFLT